MAKDYVSGLLRETICWKDFRVTISGTGLKQEDFPRSAQYSGVQRDAEQTSRKGKVPLGLESGIGLKLSLR